MDEVPLTSDDTLNKTVDIEDAKSIMIKTSGHKKIHYCCFSMLRQWHKIASIVNI
jgi:hypothetical protein